MIIDGKQIAQTIEKELKASIDRLQGRKPALAFIRVGEDPASLAYIRRKKKKCAEVGITSTDIELDETISHAALLEKVETLNRNEMIDGILIQLPLPRQIDVQELLQAVAVTKDVDGFHPLNVGKLLVGDQTGFFPCTPYGIQTLLHRAGIDPAGKHAVIVGRSNLVGKPLAALLMQKRKGANATVTIAHSQTNHLQAITSSADILVAAMGRPHLITKEMVKPGATVIDVGINRVGDALVGDVDFEQVKEVCSAITPVPGGVGPMTIAMLLSNTLLAYQRRSK